MSEKIFEKGLLSVSIEIDGWQIKMKEVDESVGAPVLFLNCDKY